MKQTTIVIADDHSLSRKGMRMLLNNEENLQVTGEAINGKELIDCVEQMKPDLVITDIEMPVMSGIEATRIIKQRYPHIGVIALTMFNDEYLIVDMMEAGANGYLLKNMEAEEVFESIEWVRKGKNYFSNDTSMRLVKQLAKSRMQTPEDTIVFTDKEKEIIKLICEQYASKEIANITQLSKRTVDKYRDHIMEKTGSTNLAGVVVYAIRHGLFKP